MEGRVFFTVFIPSLVSWPSDWWGYICPRLPDFHHIRQPGKTTGSQLTSHKTSCCCPNTWFSGCYRFGSYSNQTQNCRRLQPLELSGALPSAALVAIGKKPNVHFFSPPFGTQHFCVQAFFTKASEAPPPERLRARLSSHGLTVILFWHKATLQVVEVGLSSSLPLTACCCHLLCPSKGAGMAWAGSGNHFYWKSARQ